MKVGLGVLSIFFVLFSIEGCGMSNEKEIHYFSKKIEDLLATENSVITPASELTDFHWNKLCFERKDFLRLNFYLEKKEINFDLNYEDYFVDEPYVEGSLANKCVTPDTLILIKKKYPGHPKPIEFFEAK